MLILAYFFQYVTTVFLMKSKDSCVFLSESYYEIGFEAIGDEIIYISALSVILVYSIFIVRLYNAIGTTLADIAQQAYFGGVPDQYNQAGLGVWYNFIASPSIYVLIAAIVVMPMIVTKSFKQFRIMNYLVISLIILNLVLVYVYLGINNKTNNIADENVNTFAGIDTAGTIFMAAFN